MVGAAADDESGFLKIEFGIAEILFGIGFIFPMIVQRENQLRQAGFIAVVGKTERFGKTGKVLLTGKVIKAEAVDFHKFGKSFVRIGSGGQNFVKFDEEAVEEVAPGVGAAVAVESRTAGEAVGQNDIIAERRAELAEVADFLPEFIGGRVFFQTGKETGAAGDLAPEHSVEGVYGVAAVLAEITEVVQVELGEEILPEEDIYCPHDVGVIAIEVASGAAEFSGRDEIFEIEGFQKFPSAAAKF